MRAAKLIPRRATAQPHPERADWPPSVGGIEAIAVDELNEPMNIGIVPKIAYAAQLMPHSGPGRQMPQKVILVRDGDFRMAVQDVAHERRPTPADPHHKHVVGVWMGGTAGGMPGAPPIRPTMSGAPSARSETAGTGVDVDGAQDGGYQPEGQPPESRRPE